MKNAPPPNGIEAISKVVLSPLNWSDRSAGFTKTNTEAMIFCHLKESSHVLTNGDRRFHGRVPAEDGIFI